MRNFAFLFGYFGSFFVIEWYGAGWIGLDWNKALEMMRPTKARMEVTLWVVPIIAFFLGGISASVTMMSRPDLRVDSSELDGFSVRFRKYFWTIVLPFLVANVLTFSIAFLILFEQQALLEWAKAVGQWKLRILLFILAPAAGVYGGLVAINSYDKFKILHPN